MPGGFELRLRCVGVLIQEREEEAVLDRKERQLSSVLPVTAVCDGVAPWPVIAPCRNWVCGQGRAQERLGLSRKKSASP